MVKLDLIQSIKSKQCKTPFIGRAISKTIYKLKESSSKIEELVSQVERKQGEENNKKLLALSNREEIKNFYEYTENCLDFMKTLEVADESEIEDLKFSFSEELMQEYKSD